MNDSEWAAEFFAALACMPYVECMAMCYRLAIMQESGRLDRYELPPCLKFEKHEPETDYRFEEFQEATGYLVFSDGSLYHYTNADDEVWYSARGFVAERIVPSYGPGEEYLSADAALAADFG